MTVHQPGPLVREDFPGIQRIEAELLRLRQLRDQPGIHESLRIELGRIIHALANALALRPCGPASRITA